MPSPKEEIVNIFEKLSPENQNALLIYARIAYTAEHSVKKSINRALGQEDNTMEGV